MKRICLLMTIAGAAACGGSGGVDAMSCGMSVPAGAPAASASPAGSPTTGRKYLLERVDDAAIVQVYADGFRDLSVKEKTLAWHLYQAAIAGRDIFYDQRYAHNLEMRDTLEAIVSHPGAIDAATLAEIQRYTKLFW